MKCSSLSEIRLDSFNQGNHSESLMLVSQTQSMCVVSGLFLAQQGRYGLSRTIYCLEIATFSPSYLYIPRSEKRTAPLASYPSGSLQRVTNMTETFRIHTEGITTGGVLNSDFRVPTCKVEPIAIVGMACRLPPDISTLGDFWNFCALRNSAWSENDKSRFNNSAFWHPNPEREGRVC
jgi:hypothetical protein